MKKDFSAETTAEQRTKDDNLHVSPACIKPNVSGCRVRPILFSGEMVRAILEGRKTQTRRKIKPKDEPFLQDEKCIIDLSKTWGWVVKREIESRPTRWEILQQFKCPYGKIGDILWVRETWNKDTDEDGEYIRYKADDYDSDWKWKPSIFMPREAARIFLKVTGIRVERLHNINTNDLKAEGVNFVLDYGPMIFQNFKELWTKINGADSWKLNPFVWAINFERCERPMDSH